MNNFMLIVSIMQNAIIGTHVDITNNTIVKKQCIQECAVNNNTIRDFVYKNKQNNESVCIVAKGNPHERCGLDIDDSIQVINRFHAYASGMFELYGKKLSSSYACINMLNGVGCGVIQNGKVIDRYGANGVGGLRKIKRLSDGKYTAIASIAGIKALHDQKSKSKYRTLDEYILNNKAFVLDVADAISELIIFEIPKNVMHIGINIYDNKISLESKNIILEAIRQSYGRKSKDYAYINLCNVGNRNEEEIKCIGAASFYNHVNVVRGNIFVMDGLPGCGKSTCAKSLYVDLKAKNIKIGAIITSEVLNDKGKRSGFKAFINDDVSGIEVARCHYGNFDKNVYKYFGSYLVNYKNIDNILVPNIWKLMSENDVIIIDEVAGMQLISQNFINTIRNILTGDKIILFTAPKSSHGKDLVNDVKGRAIEYNQLYTIDQNNRNSIISNIKDSIVSKIISGG